MSPMVTAALSLPLRHPRRVLVVFGLATLAWLPSLGGLRLETDGRALLPPEHSALAAQRHVDEVYGGADWLVVGVVASQGQGLFSVPTLERVRRVERRLAGLEGVSDVTSLTSEACPRWSPAGLVLEPALVGPVTDAEAAAAVARTAMGEPLFSGTLVAEDLNATALYLATAPTAPRRALHRRVAEVLTEEAGGGIELHLLGSVAAESQLGDHVLADLALLLPLALLVVAAALWVWFRHWAVVAVGLGEAGAVVIWSLGLLAACDRALSLVTVVMPVILATYCVADTVYIAQHYRHRRRDGAVSDSQAMGGALRDLVRPIFLTSLTTCVGFSAFAFSPIPPLRDLGFFTALGVVVALGVSLFVVPAALVVSGFGDRSPRRGGWAAGVVRRLARGVVAAAERPAVVLAVVVVLCTLAIFGFLRLRVQDSWLENFDPESALARSDRWFNQQFLGSNILELTLAAQGPDEVYSPRYLGLLQDLQHRLESLPEVGGSRSLADHLATVPRLLEGDRRLPASTAEARQWDLLVRMAGGGRDLEGHVDPKGEETKIRVFLRSADYGKTGRVLAAVESFDWGGPRPRLRFAGDAYLGYVLVDSITRSLRSSLVAALAATFLLVLVVLRSVTTALLVTLPVSLAVLVSFAALGWLGIPVGVATSTFSAIALGIGIDFALHWDAGLRRARRRHGDRLRVLYRSSLETGSAILLHGVVSLCGFGVLLASSVPPNRRLGLLVGLNLLVCLLATLWLLPAVAGRLGRRFGAAVARPVPASAAVRSLR